VSHRPRPAMGTSGPPKQAASVAAKTPAWEQLFLMQQGQQPQEQEPQEGSTGTAQQGSTAAAATPGEPQAAEAPARTKRRSNRQRVAAQRQAGEQQQQGEGTEAASQGSQNAVGTKHADVDHVLAAHPLRSTASNLDVFPQPLADIAVGLQPSQKAELSDMLVAPPGAPALSPLPTWLPAASSHSLNQALHPAPATAAAGAATSLAAPAAVTQQAR
jgi:hypothetical protein